MEKKNLFIYLAKNIGEIEKGYMDVIRKTKEMLDVLSGMYGTLELQPDFPDREGVSGYSYFPVSIMTGSGYLNVTHIERFPEDDIVCVHGYDSDGQMRMMEHVCDEDLPKLLPFLWTVMKDEIDKRNGR